MRFRFDRGLDLPVSRPARQPMRVVIVRGPSDPIRTYTLPRGLAITACSLLSSWIVLTGFLLLRRPSYKAPAVASLPPESTILAPTLSPSETNDDELTAIARTTDEVSRHTSIAPRFLIESANTGQTVDVVLSGLGGEPDSPSYAALRRLLRCPRTDSESPIDPRLIETLHQIAEHAQTKVQIVSAFRAPTGRSDRNYHTRGMAADIRVPGMSVESLRDLAKSLGVRGVGYYPVSKFIHVDVRELPYSWIDRSGPTNTIARRDAPIHRQEDEVEVAIESE